MEAVLISGLSIGSMYAVVGLGLVLEYRFSKIVNLAHGGQALLGAYIFNDLRHVNLYLAIVVGVSVAAQAVSSSSTWRSNGSGGHRSWCRPWSRSACCW